MLKMKKKRESKRQAKLQQQQQSEEHMSEENPNTLINNVQAGKRKLSSLIGRSSLKSG